MARRPHHVLFRRVLTVAVIAATSCTVGLSFDAVPVHALPTGFTDDLVSGSLSGPTGITALPDGRALITQKGGALRVLSAAGVVITTPALTLPVCTNSEEGLLGAAVDATFATDHFVYLYYTRMKPSCTTPVNRVSRFTMSGDTIDAATEVPLLDNMAISGGNHNGGDLHVGNDGDLYVSIGDAGINPRGVGGSAALDLGLLNGKIVRINTDGSVPADNPFVGDPAAVSCKDTGTTTHSTDKCTQIYDWGLRNPYRFAMDPNTAATRFYINDVGQNTWEEVDHGGKGLNYGWDVREGFCPNDGLKTNCAPGIPTPVQYTDPITSYGHAALCAYITAGAFVPNGLWPQRFDGSYLFADGGCGTVWQLQANGAVDYADPFAQTMGGIVDMTFLTQGGATALYYVTTYKSELHKISYHPATPVITAPNVTAEAVTTSGAAVNYAAPTATDYRGTVPVTCVPAAGSLFPIGVTTVSCTASNVAGSSTATFTVNVLPFGQKLADQIDFAALTPSRLADTRVGQSTVDGLFAGAGRLGGGQTMELTVAGRGGVPADAVSASLNVTAVDGGGAGFVTVYPCGAPKPVASSLNFGLGTTVPNAVVAGIGSGGKVCLFASVATDLVVDVNGSFPHGTGLVAVGPARVLDTRPGSATIDGASAGAGAAAAGSITTVPVAGRAGVPADAAMVVLNVTVTDAPTDGYVTAYPCGGPPPTASNINAVAGVDVAGMAIVKVGAGGAVCLYSQSGADLVVDVSGFFPAGSLSSAITPARLFDSRSDAPTVDGLGSGGGPRQAGSVTSVQVTGRGGMPVGAVAAIVNITVTGGIAAGFVTAYPCGIDPPLASNVNHGAGQTVANAAIVRIGASGTVCLFNSQQTDVVLDVSGYLAG